MGVTVQDPTPQDARLCVDVSGRLDFACFRGIEKAVRKSLARPPGLFVLDLSSLEGIDPWLCQPLSEHLSSLTKAGIKICLVFDAMKAMKMSFLKSLKETYATVNKREDVPEPEPAQAVEVTFKMEPVPAQEPVLWRIRKSNGKIYGHFTIQQLTAFVAEGRLLPKDFVSTPEMQDWAAAHDLPELKSHFERKELAKLQWHVRSAIGEVRGPYPTDQVIEMLRMRAIAPGETLSSTKEPETWLDPTDIPVFSETIEAIGESPTSAQSIREPDFTPVLSVTEGSDAGREIIIEEGTMMIGRGTEATFSLLDKLMSRVHCKIVRQGRQVMFNDLGSTNGSFINEVKVECRELKPGDVLRLGGTVFVFNVK